MPSSLIASKVIRLIEDVPLYLAVLGLFILVADIDICYCRPDVREAHALSMDDNNFGDLLNWPTG